MAKVAVKDGAKSAQADKVGAAAASDAGAVTGKAVKPAAPVKAAPMAGGVTGLLKAAMGGVPVKETKSKTPQVNMPELSDAVEKYIAALEAKKNAEATMADMFSMIAPAAESKRVEASRKAGENETSLRINNRLTFVQPHGYKQINPSSEDALRAVLGDKYDIYFKTVNEVRVKAESLSTELVEGLMKLCGDLKLDFAEVFDVKMVIAPQPVFTDDRVLKPEVQALYAAAHSQGLIEAKKATLKE